MRKLGVKDIASRSSWACPATGPAGLTARLVSRRGQRQLPVPLAALLVVSATLCQAGLLNSFTDDFDRAELGPNYATAGGAAFAIGEGQVLTNGGAGQDLTYLNLGTLPTTEDYANG